MVCRIVEFVLLCVAFSSTSSRVHYVRPMPCSTSVSDDSSLSCDTLEQLFKSNMTRERNMTLVLSPGNHSLTSELVVADTHTFIIQSGSKDRDTFVVCNNSAKVSFTSVAEVQIKGLKFIGCGENTMEFVGSLTVTECVFIGTMVSGTPLVLNKTAAHIKDSQFLSNTVGRDYYYNNTNVTFTSTYIEKTHISVGGALVISYSNVTLVRCIFDRNSAESGAAIFTKNKSNLTFIECSFLNSVGTVIDANDGSCITDHGSAYENNIADLGAVFYVIESTLSFFGSHFTNNTATNKGGVIFSYKSDVSLTKTLAVGNVAENGGVVYQLLGSLTITSSNISRNVAYKIGVLNIEGRTVLINDSTFSYNEAHLGMIFLSKVESFNISTTTNIERNNVSMKGVVYAQDCNIEVNGKVVIQDNVARLSTVNIVRCNASFRRMVIYDKNSASFTVINSVVTFYGKNTFKANGLRAGKEFAEGGAITMIQSTLLIRGQTKIEDNFSASSGGGIYAIESIIEMLSTKQVCIKNNSASFSGGAVYLYSSVLICECTCLISANKVLDAQAGFGGGVHAIGSSILVSKPPAYKVKDDDFDKKRGVISIRYGGQRSIFRIESNCATQGGGLYFESNSKLYIQGNTNSIVFSDNRACFGGAIFINDDTTASVCASDSNSTIVSVKTECFVQKFHYIDVGYIMSSARTSDKPPIEFKNNSASQSGSVLFGGLLDRCTVSPLFSKEYVEEGGPIRFISGTEYFSNLTSVDYEDETLSYITSQPVRICFCEFDTSQHDCSYHPPPYHVTKGEKFNVSLVAVDHVGHAIDANISSSVSQHGDLAEGETVMETGKRCRNFTFSIKSTRSYDEELTIYANGPCHWLGMSKSVVTVIFKDCVCPWGFEPADNTTRECSCVCAKELAPYVACDYPNRAIRRIPGHQAWIGTCNENFTKALKNESCYLIHPNCPFDYCTLPNNDYIDLSRVDGLDSQCAFNRSGLLCGSCKQGLSLSVGSSKCISCPKSWPGLVVATLLYVVVVNLIMVIAIVALDLTVARGTINGLLFYANVVGSSSTLFLKFQSTKFDVLTVFLGVLNVTFGFDVCFAEGMNAILKTWLGLLASGYVFALVFFLVQLTKYSPTFARFFGKGNPVATLATLMLLFYAKLLWYIIRIFSFAVIKYPNGSHVTVWRPDASVEYLSTGHIPLFMVGILIIVLGFGYTVLLFCWQWLLQLPKIKIFKWLRNSRLNLFMEANLVPYKPKYRFWTGLLLFVRIVLYLASVLNVSNNSRLHLLAVGVCVTSLIVFKAYIGNTIYKNAFLDYLEVTYYFNIVLLTIATSYYSREPYMQSIAAATSISVVLVVFLCTLIYHIVLALRNTKWGKELKARIESYYEKTRFGENRERLLYLNLPQGIEMNSVEVGTPTSSVVSLSPQDHDVTARNEECEGNEQQFHCSVKSEQLRILNEIYHKM